MELMAFLTPFITITIAEMGDKTMFLVMALSSKYRLKHILIGIAFAVILLNVIAVGAGSLIGDLIPPINMKIIAGILFIVFSIITIFEKEKKEDKEKKIGKFNFKIPIPIIIGSSFFLAELGDKTQLSTMSIAASSAGHELYVFAGGVAGLLAGDIIGIILGRLLGNKVPKNLLKWLSALVFFAFGLYSLIEAFIAI